MNLKIKHSELNYKNNNESIKYKNNFNKSTKNEFSISAIITAAGKNSRMRNDLKNKNLPMIHKLLLDLNEKPIILNTIHNVLSTDVQECIIVVGHFKEEIIEAVNSINDSRIKIVENKNNDVPLSCSLLNGIRHSSSNFSICVAADQPTITVDTYNNLINNFLKFKNSDEFKKNNTDLITVLSRIKSGWLDTAEGLGMPFIASKEILIKYLENENSNLNPILRKMKSNDILFYGIKESNHLELININNYDDYQYVLNNLNKEL